MRSLLGPSGVIIGLVGLFLGARALVAVSGSIELAVVAVGSITLGLILLHIDESQSSRSR